LRGAWARGAPEGWALCLCGAERDGAPWASERLKSGGGAVECIMCSEKIELGTKVIVMPFPAAGEGRYLVAHQSCLPGGEEIETNMAGYFLGRGERFFVPRERVVDLEPVNGLTWSEYVGLQGPEWADLEPMEEEVESEA